MIKNDGEYEKQFASNKNSDKRLKRHKKDRLDRGKKFSTYGRRCRAERIQMKRLNRMIHLDEKKERRRYQMKCKCEKYSTEPQCDVDDFDQKILTLKKKTKKSDKNRAAIEKIERLTI